ncbi:MAG TPA: AmmeMemoRadiSam system radical SAM enzyme [Candidatus Latescibacteria bacterium]|nr:AmmeMemoRadiSam system radical SAM enzyme [Candidatus Latescibacterota bacterium]
MYYKDLGYGMAECQLCPKRCTVADQQRGFCRVRKNLHGKYYTLVHSNPCAAHIDPIEKKPFFHFLPTTLAFSIATAGCNFVCKFCQNWEIAQSPPERTNNVYLPPEKLAQYAKKAGCTSVAYTYSEPVIFYEYMLDASIAAKEAGLKNVMITNGFISPEPMEELCRHLDAVKIDLKAFTEEYYKEICAGQLQPVLDILKLLKKIGIWYEIVYLVVPTLNDTDREFEDVCTWIAGTLGKDVPVHFSRFYPNYMLRNLPMTPVRTLERARAIATKAGLKYVYIGNVPGHEGESTFCPNCKKVLIRRAGYNVTEYNLNKGKCKFCGEIIPGVWS